MLPNTLQGNYFVLSALSHLVLKQTYKVGTIFILFTSEENLRAK